MTLIISVVFVYFPILLIPFLFLLPTMIVTLFKKNIHAFFTLPTTTTTTTKTGDYKLQLHHHHPISSSSSSSSSSGLGLISVTQDADRPPNVVESAMLKPSPPASPSASAKRNIGFIDDIGGEVDGLMSCTETLGFESSDERLVDNRIDDDENGNSDDSNYKVNDDWIRRRRESWRKVRSFPPPLTSLNRNGEPSFFLRPVRKDGRLELTEVRIHRQEILHASRHDGRLTLHLIPDHSVLEEEDDDDDEEEEEEEEVEQEEEEEEEEEVAQEEEEQKAQQQVEEGLVMVDYEQEEEEEEEIGYEKEEEERVGEWRFGNDYEGGLRRCHEMVNQHHHHHHHHHHGVQFHGGHHLRMCGISIV